MDFLTDIVFIVLQGLLTGVSYLSLGRKISQPGVLFSLVWWIILILHLLFRFTLLNQLQPLSIEVYIVFLTGTLFFVAGSGIADYSRGSDYAMHEGNISIPDIHIVTRIIFFLIILVGLPFYIRAAFRIFLESQAEDFFSGLRYELSYGDADIGPLKYLMPLAYVLFAFNLCSFFQKRNLFNAFLLLFTFLILATYAVFATGRTYFFMILTIYFGISFFYNPRFSVWRTALALLGFLLMFMIFGVLYGKGGRTEDSLSDNVKAASENVGIYTVTALNALDIELDNHSAGTSKGDNTLRFFYKAGMQLKVIPDRKISQLIQEFVFVPYPTNVYTVYSPYIRDFGKLYAWLMLALFGALHTWLFRKARAEKSVRDILYYTYLLFPLTLSFFGDQYMTLFSFWLQMIFFTEFLLVINQITRLLYARYRYS